MNGFTAYWSESKTPQTPNRNINHGLKLRIRSRSETFKKIVVLKTYILSTPPLRVFKVWLPTGRSRPARARNGYGRADAAWREWFHHTACVGTTHFFSRVWARSLSARAVVRSLGASNTRRPVWQNAPKPAKDPKDQKILSRSGQPKPPRR